jgi:hypothetical protein
MKPYGWDQWSIAAVVGYLAGKSKIEIQLNGKVLARTEITSALRNTQSYPQMVIAPQRLFDPKIVGAFRKFVIEFTDDGAISKDPLELARVGKEHLTAKLAELKALRTGARYPFIDQLDEPVRLLTELCKNKADWFVTDFTGADYLLDAKDNTIDPIKAFLNGAQRGIYDNAAAFVQTNQSNLAYLPSGVTDDIHAALEDPQVFRGNRTTQLSAAVKNTEEQLEKVIGAQRAAADDEIKARWEQVPASKAYGDATEAAQQSVTRKTQAVLDRVQHERQISGIKNLASQFADTIYPEILDELDAGRPVPLTGSTEPGTDPSPDSTSPPAPVKQTVSIKKLALPGAGQVLETEADIDGYVDQLRTTLLATIHDNKRITL